MLIQNLAQMSPIKSYWILHNTRVAAITVSEVGEEERGGGVKVTPPPRLGLRQLIVFYGLWKNMGHSFSMCPNFSGKLTFLNPQMFSFSENFCTRTKWMIAYKTLSWFLNNLEYSKDFKFLTFQWRYEVPETETEQQTGVTRYLLPQEVFVCQNVLSDIWVPINQYNQIILPNKTFIRTMSFIVWERYSRALLKRKKTAFTRSTSTMETPKKYVNSFQS